MKLLVNFLAHPYWTGVGAIATICAAVFTFNQMGSRGVDSTVESRLPAVGKSNEGESLEKDADPNPLPEPALIARPVDFPDLAGRWRIENVISETSFKPFKGLMVYYLVEVKQDADAIVITGEKDGEVYKAEESKYTGNARTRIEGAGQVLIDPEGGFKLKVAYQEESTSKEGALEGVFDLKFIESGEIRGEVVSEAADSRGDTVWRLIESKDAQVAQSGQ